tara:strand:- start:102 stop:386 length:285 start_codon:yes stop_codon:yes gene_type:complete
MDWTDLATGLAIGLAVCAVFFAGLALGVRIAVRSARPGMVLAISAGIRIAMVLAAAWATAQISIWSMAGFGLAFLAARLVVLALTPALARTEGR